MPTYLSPGVYVEEVEAGSRPIEGVGTAVAAFVGLAAKGPLNEPTLVTNWGQFTSAFGEFVEGTFLAHAVYAYFQNGGGACYVVRVGGEGNGNGSSPARGELPTGADARLGAYRVRALEPGAAGNTISVEITQVQAERGRVHLADARPDELRVRAVVRASQRRRREVARSSPRRREL